MKYLQVKHTPNKGRGVYADKHFEPGETIEVCPIIHLPAKETALCEQTVLDNYLFEWSTKDDAAIVLGYGSLYNHSYHPNAYYYRDIPNKCFIFKSLTTINHGDEILVNYNGDPNDFEPIDIEGVPPPSFHENTLE